MSQYTYLVKGWTCRRLDDINRAITEQDPNWEGLTSADQIISLTGALWTAITVAGMGIFLFSVMCLLILLPEEISNRIYDWRHRRK